MKKPPTPCTVPGCGRISNAKGLCNRHYLQAWKGKKFTIEGWEEDLGMPAIAPFKVALEIAEGKRCACGLLKPCGMCVFESSVQQGQYIDE